MFKAFTVAAAALVLPTTAHATFTECAAVKEIALATRPDGPTEPRWLPIEKGGRVAIRDTYRDWVFVVHYEQSGEGDGKTVTSLYGWLPRKALGGCKQMDGTP